MTGETVIAPIEGTIVDLSKVPDQVFSQKMVGDGFAIIPAKGEIVSPVDGVITTIFPTKHAIGITSKSNLELLIHIGVDTVSLNGEGFEAFVKAGDEVKAGTKLLQVDFDLIKDKVPSIVSPIVFTNLQENQYVAFNENKRVKLGEAKVASVESK